METLEVMRRLAFVRYLYLEAVEQSRKPEPLSYVSLLLMHDSVELFLQAAAAHKGVDLARTDFMTYWKQLKKADIQLPEEAGMSRLNKARNTLKHDGHFPSANQLEAFRATCTTFFESSCPLVFGIEFEEVSLLHVLANEDVRNSISEAERLAAEDKLDEALTALALAFRQEVDGYEARRCKEFGAGYRSLDIERVATGDGEGWTGPRWEDFVEVLFGALQALDLGLDHARYVKFQMLSPVVWRTYSLTGSGYSSGGPVTRRVHRPATREDYEFCHGFVIEAAIKIERL